MPRSSVLRASVAGLLTAVLACTTLLAAGSASAAEVPYAPTYHAGIDRYSSYEPESTCSPTAKPGVLAYRDLLIRTYGARWNNIARACSASVSGHEEGRALDYGSLATNATQKAQADGLLGWLLATDKHGNKHAMARRLGIQYIQYNNRMWRAYDPNAGWQPQMMGGKACSTLGSSYTTSCHRDHIHTSFSWAGANKKTTYFTGSIPCPNPVAQPAFTAAMPTNLTAVPITPARLFDTRYGAAACRLAPGGEVNIKVRDVGGVPATGVGAVVLNLAGVRPTGTTFLSAFPAGTTWNGTSSVNIAANRTAASLVTVPVGSGGMVTVRNGAAPIDFFVDVVGYFTTLTTGATYSTVTAQRVLDTRHSEILAAGTKVTVPVRGSFGVPASATGLLVNATVPKNGRGGFVTVAPSVEGVPSTSTVNFGVADTVANRAMVMLSPEGAVEVYASTAAHVVLDVVGWFGSGGQGLRYNTVKPSRILDTRHGIGGLDALQGGTTSVLDVGGRGGVPEDAKSIMATLTVTGPSKPSFATAWSGGADQPGTSDLNFPQGTTRANLIAPEISSDGAASLTINSGQANAVVDVLGYFR
jgi:hypothetical protein